MVKRRAVSAPYWSICVFRFRHFFNATDIDGLSIRFESGGNGASLFVQLQFDFFRIEPAFFAGSVFTVIGFIQDHALCQQFDKGFVEFHQSQITHDFCPETGVKQVHDRVFDTPDILVHRHPVIVPFIDHRLV